MAIISSVKSIFSEITALPRKITDIYIIYIPTKIQKAGKSQCEISHLVGISRNGVRTSLARYRKTESNVDQKRSGRPKKTNKHNDVRVAVKKPLLRDLES